MADAATTDSSKSLAALADDLRVVHARTLRGPNVTHLAPIVLAELRAGELAGVAPADAPDFVERLVDALPGISSARRGSPLRSWGDALLRVALELQRLAGAPVTFGQVTTDDGAPGGWTIAIGYDEDELTTETLYEGARILRDCLRGDDVEIDATIRDLTRRYHRARPEPAMLATIEAARRRGIPVRRDPEEAGVVQLGLGATQRLLSPTTPGVGGAMLDLLYPAGVPTTIPLIAVTGTNGKTTTTRLVAHLFRGAGLATGFATTDGVYFQEQLLLEGDLTGPFAASLVLSHPGVEVAVIETARGGILRSGLGYDQCDVGIVLNVTSDHLGMRGIETVEQLADVKGVIAAVVKPTGYAVLNADDALVHAMRERTPGTCAFFTTWSAAGHPVIAAHLASGGIAGSVERGRDGDMIVIHAGAARHEIALVNDVPLTFGGAARFQIENILAASLAAFTQGLSPETIRAGLMTFIPSATHTPGRVNVIDTARGRVIIDYAHNIAAIGALLDFVAALPAERRIVLLGMPGDRRDEDIRAVARLASSMDQVIFKEHDAYRRGRAPGEVAALMADALADAGFPRERIATFATEDEAVAHALEMMRSGDVVAITADDAESARAQVEALGAT